LISKNAFRRPGDAVAFAREGISRARDASRCAVVCCVSTVVTMRLGDAIHY